MKSCRCLFSGPYSAGGGGGSVLKVMTVAEQMYLVMGAVLVDQVVDRVEVVRHLSILEVQLLDQHYITTVGIVGPRGFYAG